MLLQFLFTSVLVNSLYFLSEGSIELNETKAFLSIKSELVDLKSTHELNKADQQMMRLDVGIIKLDQQQIRSDLEQIKNELISCKSGQENTTSKTRETRSDKGWIQEELTLLKTGQKRIESMLSADKVLIQEELTLLKAGQQRLESMLNVFIEKLKPFSDLEKEEVTTQTPNRISNGRSCAEAMTTSRRSEIYEILISSYSVEPFKVACDDDAQGGNWTIILRRMDGSVDFYRKWADYKEGFGNLTGEFFLGLDKIYALTNDKPQELLVLLEDFEGEVRYEEYDAFAIGDELDLYKLHTLGKATGSAGDSLSYHHRMNFTSQDKDNDENTNNCAVKYTGGWWYGLGCHRSNLMGRYKDNTYGKGINWYDWHGFEYSLKRAVMMIRPKKI